MGGVALPAGNLLPYPMSGSSKEHSKAPKADVEKAKALLKEAGYPNGFDHAGLALGPLRERLQGGAGDRVHVDAHRREDQRGRDGAAGVLQEPRFLCVLGLSGGLVGDQRRDVHALTALLVTRNPEAGLGTTNRSRYSNPKMDELVKEASSTMDDAKRADLLARASNIAMDDYAMLPVHFELSVWAMKGDIRYQGRPDQVTLAQFATLKK